CTMISALRVFQAAAFIAKRSFSRPAGLRKRPLTLLKRRKPRLCDLHVVLRGVEAGADGPDDLAFNDDWQTALHLGKIMRRDSRDPAVIDDFLQRSTRLLEQRRSAGFAWC